MDHPDTRQRVESECPGRRGSLIVGSAARRHRCGYVRVTSSLVLRRRDHRCYASIFPAQVATRGPEYSIGRGPGHTGADSCECPYVSPGARRHVHLAGFPYSWRATANKGTLQAQYNNSSIVIHYSLFTKGGFMKRLYLLLVLLVLALGGCGSATTQQVTVTPAPTAQPTQATKAVATAYAGQTALQVLQHLKAHGLPIGVTYVYTAETDLNHLLGRPGQYTGKAEFADTRLPASGDQGANISVSDGGSVEVFATVTDVQHRLAYIQGLSTSGNALFAEYEYLDGEAILRVSNALTPAQAAAYKAAFLA